jgi:hypothetical protein
MNMRILIDDEEVRFPCCTGRFTLIAGMFRMVLQCFCLFSLIVWSEVIQMHSNFNRSGSHEDKIAWLQLRKEYINKIYITKTKANGSLILNADNQFKTAWKIINHEVGPSHLTSALPFSPDGLNKYFIASIDDIIANINFPSTTSIDLIKKVSVAAPNFKWTWVTPSDIQKVIYSLKKSFSAGIYGISTNLVRELADVIKEPLAIICNTCFQSGAFPKAL